MIGKVTFPCSALTEETFPHRAYIMQKHTPALEVDEFKVQKAGGVIISNTGNQWRSWMREHKEPLEKYILRLRKAAGENSLVYR